MEGRGREKERRKRPNRLMFFVVADASCMHAEGWKVLCHKFDAGMDAPTSLIVYARTISVLRAHPIALFQTTFSCEILFYLLNISLKGIRQFLLFLNYGFHGICCGWSDTRIASQDALVLGCHLVPRF